MGKQVGPQVWQQFLLSIPTSGLRVFEEQHPAKGTQWIAAPAPGQQVVVTVLVAPGDLDVLRPPSVSLLGTSTLSDGRRIWALAGIQEGPAGIDRMIERMRQRVPKDIEPRLKEVGVRVLLHGEVDGLVGYFMETSADVLVSENNPASDLGSS